MYGLKGKFLIFLLRIGMGWVFFYSGVSKILQFHWSAYNSLAAAKTLTPLFAFLAQSQIIGWVNFLNEWSQLLIGAALLIGIFVRQAAWGGVALMVLYYLAALDFPRAGANGYIVDYHIIYALVLLLLIRLKAGKHFGLSAISERFSS